MTDRPLITDKERAILKEAIEIANTPAEKAPASLTFPAFVCGGSIGIASGIALGAIFR